MAGCSLDRSSKHNWVEDAGGLPEGICEVARAIARGGKDLDSAIPIAISQTKKRAAAGNAKAIKAIAQWEALKAKSKAKKGAHEASEKVAASDVLTAEQEKLLNLTFDAVEEAENELMKTFLAAEAVDEFSLGAYAEKIMRLANAEKDWSLDAVRGAYMREQAEKRKSRRSKLGDSYYDDPQYRNVRDVRSNDVLVSSGYGDDAGVQYFRVPYEVSGDGKVTFGAEVEVKQTYTPVGSAGGEGITLSAPSSALQRFLRFHGGVG